MKRNANRRISGVIAMTLALSVIGAGCQQVNEDGGAPSLNDVTLTQAEVTDTITETSAESETETEAESEVTTTPASTEIAEEMTTTVPESTIVTTAPTESAAETTAQTWTETEKSVTMYVTEDCWSRENAIVGSTPISRHYKGDAVEIIAVTNTDYYKLAEGGFIHSDYLSDKKPAETQATTTAAANTSDNTGSNGSSSGGTTGGSSITSGSYSVDPTSRYVYKQLNAQEQQLYLDIIDAVYNLEPYAQFPISMSSDNVFKVFSLVYNCEPQLFWMDSSVSVGSSRVSINYVTTDEADIKAKQKEIANAASTVISKVNNYSGTVSKLKVIFDYLVLNNEFASGNAYNSTIYNGLTGRGGIQCAGYAKSMQYLCDLAGIECTTVLGITSADVSHAWNVVYCENGYYNIDATWGDPLNDFDSSYIQYEFFLVPDSWIHDITHFHVAQIRRSNGTLVDLVDPPSCTKEACNYFAAYNKLYDNKSDAETAMYNAISEAIKNGSNVAEIRVTSAELYNTLMSDEYFKTFQKYAKSQSGSVSKLLRRGANSKGVQVVHYDIVY